MSNQNVSNLYTHSGKVPFASRLSTWVRQQTFALFMGVIQPQAHHTVLDIGVTNDEKHPESNFFEQWYPHKTQITCVGTENGKHLEERYPGITFQQVTAGKSLPFADNAFDIVFSNAVIEHVGNHDAQRHFIQEACRVGKRAFITTPNRWFPVEHHTGIPLLHYLPKQTHRQLLRNTSYDYWSHEQNLNILEMRTFKALFPSDASIVGQYVGVLNSNLVIYTR
jgi:SAM-dependent methyltransferase